MPRDLVIRGRQVEADPWRVVGLAPDEPTRPLPDGPVLVPLAHWKAQRAELAARSQLVTMRLPVRERHQDGAFGHRPGELFGRQPDDAPRIVLDRAVADHQLTRHGAAPCRGRRAP